METVILPQALAQVIHDYLLTRPMGEVEQMVVALRRARPNGSAEEQKLSAQSSNAAVGA